MRQRDVSIALRHHFAAECLDVGGTHQDGRHAGHMGLLWAVVAFTVASWIAYFFEALRALRAVDAAPGA